MTPNPVSRVRSLRLRVASAFEMAAWRDDITDIADLYEGLVLEGKVTNVTHFGAFVDIGVKQDGLVHISKMANQ